MNDTYKQYLESDEWKLKRKTKYRKSRTKKCAICMDWQNLEVHHLIYKPNLENIESSDLRILCNRCHGIAHKLIKSGVIKFRSDNHNSRFATTKNHVKTYLKLYPNREERIQRRKERDEWLKANYGGKSKSFKVKYPEVTQLVTETIINMGMSRNGGWSLRQFKLFGFDTFPKKGWKEMIISQEWPREIVVQFLALKNVHMKF